MTNQIDKLIDELPTWRGNDGMWFLCDLKTDDGENYYINNKTPLPTEDTIMMTREELRGLLEKVRG